MCIRKEGNDDDDGRYKRKKEIIILRRISCRVDVDQGRGFAFHLSPQLLSNRRIARYKQRLGNQISSQVEESRIARSEKTRGPGFLQKFIRD